MGFIIKLRGVLSWELVRVSSIALVALLSACQKKTLSEAESSGAIEGALLSATQPPPNTLAETNLFLADSALEPSPGVEPYKVHVPLWSDGAYKERYYFLPVGEKVTMNPADGTFSFPIGTTFIKQFMSADASHTPVETRIATLRADGEWKFMTYVWNDDGTATLNTNPRVVKKLGVDYRIPSEKECKMCHNADSQPSVILGFKVKQLKTTLPTVSGAEVSQIEHLLYSGRLGNSLDELNRIPGYAQAANTNVDLNTRMRTYMDVNCATCHRPNGPTPVKLDLRLEAPDTHLVSEGKLVPQDLDKSIVWQRVSGTSNRMPYISLRSDPVALELFKAYILNYTK